MKRDKTCGIPWHSLDELLVEPGLKLDVRYGIRGGIGPHSGHIEAHRHEFYTLGISGAKPGVHMVDFRHIDMPPYSMFLLSPWQVHMPTDWARSADDVYLISFMPDFLPAGMPSLPICMENPVTPDAESFKEIWHLCEQLYREYTQRKALLQPVLQHYVALLLTLFMRYLPENNTVRSLQPELLTRYQELMETHVLSWSSSGDYARALHVTTDHLNEVVKQETGQTASALLAARRILEAKRMLLHSTQGIKEIAWHLHFNEVTYFNRFFKQHTGQTPVAFRIASREMYNYTPE
ncbi:MAG: AraC family transcriptional regulator [Chitinophaga sp.]|uniref:helix-turn-helix domain-containing protein n=1 Tax=Chitinophaga sp. TaxID=1869181 RepID=UPI001B15731E|nr:helix-turn-helix transcriptional regulator [Chitinophaga sp.]MBO9728054.1 AraC family transcriptional regulator [Chitinophaga sp.]